MTAQHGDLASPASPDEILVGLLQTLGDRVAAEPTEAHRAATRARLVAMAAVRTPGDSSGAVRSPVPPRLRRLVGRGAPRWRSRMTAGLAGGALTVGALGGVLAASQGAAPGDLLYDVKRGGEQTQLALAGDAGRGRTLLDFASTRLTELTELTRGAATALPAGGRGPAGTMTVLAAGIDPGTVVDTLAMMDRQTTGGARDVTARSVATGDAAPLTDLASWAAHQQTGLSELSGAVPPSAGPALTGSTELAAAVAERATALVTALACPVGTPTAGVDDLGPIPVPCSPAPSRAARDEADRSATASVSGGGIVADPTAGPADADTAEPGPPPAPAAEAATAPVPAPEPGAAVPSGPTGEAPRPDRGAAAAGTAGRTLPAPAQGTPGRGGRPVPPPAPSAATPGSARSSTPPVVDLPLPLCVSALGLPVLC